MRKVKDSTKQILNLTQLSFHQIRKNEITQVVRSALLGSGVYGGLWVNTLAGGSWSPDRGDAAPGVKRREKWSSLVWRFIPSLFNERGKRAVQRQHGSGRRQFLTCHPQWRAEVTRREVGRVGSHVQG